MPASRPHCPARAGRYESGGHALDVFQYRMRVTVRANRPWSRTGRNKPPSCSFRSRALDVLWMRPSKSLRWLRKRWVDMNAGRRPRSRDLCLQFVAACVDAGLPFGCPLTYPTLPVPSASGSKPLPPSNSIIPLGRPLLAPPRNIYIRHPWSPARSKRLGRTKKN
ncbi:hypothetical protein FKP32DRAFT_1003078 [Trametes sanguinea]|nr:hypothetical protein FKP32DRAFT_1003078 [Trametes sanguinea]